MSDTLKELARLTATTAGELAAAVDAGNHELAKRSAREVLSLCSKLHQRLGILVEMSREAEWTAQVDRAVRASKPKPEIPGQATIQEAIAEASAESKPKTPRKRGGRG